MKLIRTFTLILLLSVMFTVAEAETCSCTAPDGSCSASVTCSGGCMKFCGNDGNCHASCAGGEGDNSSGLSGVRVTLKITEGNSEEISSELERVTGKDVKFVAKKRSRLFNFEFKDTLLWDVLNTLSHYGKITINGLDFEQLKKLRSKLSDGEKVSMCLKQAPVKRVLSHLSFITGMSLSAVSGDAEQLISLSFRAVTINEIISKISEQAGVEIAVTGPLPSNNVSSSGAGLQHGTGEDAMSGFLSYSPQRAAYRPLWMFIGEYAEAPIFFEASSLTSMYRF